MIEGKLGIKALMRWGWRSAAGLKGRLCGACVAGCLRVGASLAFVWISKVLVDYATEQQALGTSRMWALAGLMGALMLLQLILSGLSTYLCDKAEVLLRNRLRSGLYACALRAQPQPGGQHHSGDLLSRLTEDTRVVASAICQSLPEIAVMVVQLAGAFWMLYDLSPTLSVCILLILPICMAVSKVYVRVMRRITASIRQREAEIQTSMQEGLQHLAVAKTLLSAPTLLSRVAGLHDRLYVETMGRTRFNIFSNSMVRAGFMLGFLFTFCWSAWQLHAGAITFGMMTAFLQLASRVQHPLAQLARYVPTLAQAYASVDRIAAIEGAPQEPDADCCQVAAPAGIKIDGLCFSYAEGERPIFDNFNYDFTPGSITAIVGPTGLGKTTLASLLLALRRPQSGSLTLYNALQQVPIGVDTRCNFAYVPQGNSLFYDSIRANLLIANPHATEAEMIDALCMADADFVLSLPQGLDTVCGERAARLSEGQAQRIAIARALLCKGPILLLDEFDSSLDPATATSIMQRLAALIPQRTIIYITHRPDMLRFATATLNLAEILV